MDVTLDGAGTVIYPNDDQLSGISLQFAAMDGEVGMGLIPIPDPSAAIETRTGQQVLVKEGAVTLTDARILDQDRTRGPNPDGTRRQHSYSIEDANYIFAGFRVRRHRPRETDIDRFLAFAALDLPSTVDLTWVDTDTSSGNVVTMDAETYSTDGGWSTFISELVDATGKTVFAHEKAAGGICVHYHRLTMGHACGLSISDVPSGVDGITVFAPGQPEYTRSSVDMANDVVAVDQTKRKFFVDNGTSKAIHDKAGRHHEVYIDVTAKSQGSLEAQARAYLESFQDDYFSRTCEIGPLDEAALALIRVGDIITVTSTVMNCSATPLRISHMTETVWSGGGRPAPGLWNVALELGAPKRRRRGISAPPPAPGTPGGPGSVYVPDPVDVTVTSCPSGDSSVTAVSVALGDHSGTQSGGSSVEGLQFYEDAVYHVTLKVVHATTNFECNITTQLENGLNIIGPINAGHDPAIGGGEDPASYPPVYLYEFDFTGVAGDLCFTAYLGEGSGYAGCNTIGSTVTYSATYTSGPDPRFEGQDNSVTPPAPGQTVPEGPISAPGGTTAGQTQFPYQPGSLKIRMNGIDLQGGGVDFTETDPALGIYTFTIAPAATAEIVVSYIAAGGDGQSLPGGGGGGTVVSPVTPPGTSTGIGDGFYPALECIQNETQDGYERVVSDGAGNIWIVQHYAAFGPACDGSNAASRLHWGDGVNKVLVAGLAPTDLDINGVGCAGSDSRIAAGDIATFAGRINTVLAGDSDIKAVAFWNELKGYYNSAYTGSWDAPAYCTDYLVFAAAIRAAHPGVLLLGPYTTGQNGQAEDSTYHLDERVRYVHQYFIDHVVTPHPTLVDGIAWDHGDGTKHRSYTAFYADQGITLPHWIMELYLPNSAGSSARILLDIATDNVKLAAQWGHGQDGYVYSPWWTLSNATDVTAIFRAIVAVSAFTAVGGVENTAPGVWTNGSAQTCRVSGDTVTVT